VNELVASARGFVRSFRTPSLAKALAALVAFSMTEWAAYIAVAVYAFDEGGAATLGMITTVTLLVAAVVAPIGSVLGDRYRRERVLLLAYGGLTLGTGATAFAMLAELPPIAVYIAAVASAAVLTIVRPTHGAVLPSLAPTPADLTAGYAASGLIESISVILGPLLATVVFALSGSLSGPGSVDAVLTVLLAIGAVLVATIRPVAEPPSEHERPPAAPSLVREVSEGVGAVWHDPRPRLLIGLLGLSMLALGAIDVSIVVLAFDVLHTGEAGVGLLNVSLGIGAVLGASAAVVVTGRRRLFGPFRTSMLLTGGPIAVTAAAPIAAAPLFGLSAAGMSLGNVVGVTMLQRLVPDAKLTRVFGVLESTYMAGEGVGALATSLLIVAVGPRWTLLAGGMLLPVIGFAVRRRIAGMDVGVRVPEHEIDVLRRTPIFGVLPGPALERVARNAVPRTVESGAEVIREGDRGDRYYVIESGTFRVARSGGTVAALGPGEGFGEVALLRDVPRTATVTAETAGRLLALHRDEFLIALTGEAEVAAHDTAERRHTEPESGS
jgi:MFS family permease